MIREICNVELFEFCETIPKVQCSECLFFLESRNCLLHLWRFLERKWIQPTFSPTATGFFLNPELRHQEGPTSWCSARQNWGTERAFRGHNARRRCLKEKFDGIHDRFQRESTHRDSQPKICWTEEKCIDMDKLAQKNHPFCPSSEEYERYKKIGTSHWTNQAEIHRWNFDHTSVAVNFLIHVHLPHSLQPSPSLREVWFHSPEWCASRNDNREMPNSLSRFEKWCGHNRDWSWLWRHDVSVQKCSGEVWARSSRQMWSGSKFVYHCLSSVEWTLVELIINESQLLLSSWNEQHQRTERPVLNIHSSRYSEWNFDDIKICCGQIVYRW